MEVKVLITLGVVFNNCVGNGKEEVIYGLYSQKIAY